MPTIKLRAFSSGKPFSAKTLQKDLLAAVDKTLNKGEKLFDRTQRTWDAKVVFYKNKAALDGKDITGAVGTDALKYLFVTRGTKPHKIRAKRAKSLAFASGYKAKTSKGFIGSKAGGSFGPTVFAPEVNHPGTEARGFEEAIADELTKDLEINVSRALQKTIER